MSPGRSGRVSTYSTAAVLWLMILLVFMPIALGHVAALIFVEAG